MAPHLVVVVLSQDSHVIAAFLFFLFSFFFNHPPTTELYTLSLHDALPIFLRQRYLDRHLAVGQGEFRAVLLDIAERREDRKSTRLNSSHRCISYAVFCLKKKKKTMNGPRELGSSS